MAIIYNNTYCVYLHTNLINGKVYVGQTIYGDNPNLRWRNGKKYEKCTHFYNAIQKYGWDNFEHEVIASNLTLQEANHFEETLIKKLDTTNPQKGYNLCSGGKNSRLSEETKKKISEIRKGKYSGENHPLYGKHHSEETKCKISKVRKGKYSGKDNPMYGKHHTSEAKNKISQINKGRPSPMRDKHHSEKTKQKMRNNHADFNGQNNPSYGTHKSEEAKKRISEANKGKLAGGNNPRAKKIIQYDLEGNFIKMWDYITQASIELNINRQSISAVCKGRKKMAGGFIWRYYNRGDNLCQ